VIVEIFGPPCSGKSTLARALVARLRTRGRAAEVWHSSRPSEVSDTQPRGMYPPALVRRVNKSLREMAAIASHPSEYVQDIVIARNLLGLLPPKRLVRATREAQYICRLAHAWQAALKSQGTFVFDQGFTQEIYSLVRRCGGADGGMIARALLSVPTPDMFIRVRVPFETLNARLVARMELLKRSERLLESDFLADLSFMHVFDNLHELLLQQGRTVLEVPSYDPGSLEAGLDLVVSEIAVRTGAPEDPSEQALHA
jgi:RecA/RadA recombinase